MTLTDLDIPEQVLEAARQASPVTLTGWEDVVLSSVIQTGLTSSPLKKLTQRRRREAVKEIAAVLDADYTLRVPDVTSSSSLTEWVRDNTTRHEPMLEEVTRRAVKDLLRAIDFGSRGSEIADGYFYNQIYGGLKQRLSDGLTQFAMRAIALRWSSRHLRDSYAVGVPKRRNGRWYVPLFRRRSDVSVAEIALDATGRVITDPDEVRAELQKLRSVA